MHMILHGALVNQACAQKDELSHHKHLWSSQKTAEQAWNQIIIYLSIQKKLCHALKLQVQSSQIFNTELFLWNTETRGSEVLQATGLKSASLLWLTLLI